MSKILFKEGGFNAFYKGLKPKLMQTVLNAGLMMVIYDKTFRTISYILKFVPKNELNVK
jgi:hypothetical protein